MRIAYFDCFSGISGDMTLGALIDCGVEPERLRAELVKLKLPGWDLRVETTSRNGIGATDVTVKITEKQAHGRHLSDIEGILAASDLSESVRESAHKVFRRLAEAEANIHQTTPDRIHFHEVGAVDAIVDIVGTCVGLELLAVERLYCSPLPMGRGFVECEHGTIPLPAPAVVELVKGFPVYGVDLEGELVTPTGAAIVTSLADGFGPLPAMHVVASGYGAGKKSFGNRPNLLRIVIGESDLAAAAQEVAVLETNLDDLSPQFYESVTERLFEAGALDVFLSPIQMKKGRPATLLTVLTAPDQVETVAGILFRETTTLGVRFSTMRRFCLDREWVTVDTAYGPIRVKVGKWRGIEMTASPEYEDVKLAGEKHRVPAKHVYQAASDSYRAGR